jgi:hypothetical protein
MGKVQQPCDLVCNTPFWFFKSACFNVTVYSKEKASSCSIQTAMELGSAPYILFLETLCLLLHEYVSCELLLLTYI